MTLNPTFSQPSFLIRRGKHTFECLDKLNEIKLLLLAHGLASYHTARLPPPSLIFLKPFNQCVYMRESLKLADELCNLARSIL